MGFACMSTAKYQLGTATRASHPCFPPVVLVESCDSLRTTVWTTSSPRNRYIACTDPSALVPLDPW